MKELLTSPLFIEATIRSILLSGTVAVISGFAGAFFAWLVTRTDCPGSQKLGALLSVPYALPPYLLAIAWIILGNPTVGLLKNFIPGASGMYGFMGMVFVMSSVTFAFPYLEVRAGFEKLDPSFEEAARMSGASTYRVFKDISLPLLWPAMINGMGLSFLYTLAAFGVPALLGMPKRLFVLTTLIYTEFKVGGSNGIKNGMILSLVLVVISIAVLIILHFIKRKSVSISGSRTSRPSLTALKNLRLPLGAFSWSVLVIILVLPWIALTLAAFSPTMGQMEISQFTLKNLTYLFTLGEFQEALTNSITLTISVTALILFLAFIIGFLTERRNIKILKPVYAVTAVIFGIPGTVIAIMLIFTGALMSRFGIPLDIPLLLIGASYFIKYVGSSLKAVSTGFTQIHPSLEEAARISGAGTFQLLRTIWFPLLKPVLIASALLTSLPIFTELNMSVLLTGPGAATLGTFLFQLQEYADQSSAAALAWLLITFAMILGWFQRKKYK